MFRPNWPYPALSTNLLEELTEVLSRPKLASRLDSTVVNEMLRLVPEAAVMASDGPPTRVCRDPDDDYLVVLALGTGSLLVSGDKDPPQYAGGARRGAPLAEAAARLLQD